MLSIHSTHSILLCHTRKECSVMMQGWDNWRQGPGLAYLLDPWPPLLHSSTILLRSAQSPALLFLAQSDLDVHGDKICELTLLGATCVLTGSIWALLSGTSLDHLQAHLQHKHCQYCCQVSVIVTLMHLLRIVKHDFTVVIFQTNCPNLWDPAALEDN